MNHSTILGIHIDTLSADEVLATIHHWIDSGAPHQIATVNVEFVMETRRNHQFHTAVQAADLKLADGAGIILAAEMLHQPIPPRIPGVDFVQVLAKEAAAAGYSLFLLGGQNGVVNTVAQILKELHPALTIVGTHEGAPDEHGLVDTIKAAKPDILLVAWGAPKQDIWIHQHKAELGVPVMMGVGGTFDFLAGVQRRAPKWMRDLWLEWLWRLVREPKRWRRQLALPQMFLLILWYKISRLSLQ